MTVKINKRDKSIWSCARINSKKIEDRSMYENVKLNRNNEAKTFIHKQNRAANYIIALFPLLKKEKKKRKKKGGLLYRQTLLNHPRLHYLLYQRHLSPQSWTPSVKTRSWWSKNFGGFLSCKIINDFAIFQNLNIHFSSVATNSPKVLLLMYIETFMLISRTFLGFRGWEPQMNGIICLFGAICFNGEMKCIM